MTPKELRNLTKELDVLYVEDDDILREATGKMLDQFFGSTDEAFDGQAGWDAYQKKSYDVVITDINMPRLNGLEMIKLIKNKNPDQIIIVTSAYNDADSLLSFIDLGVDKFLLKPMDFSKLIESLIHSAVFIQNKNQNFDTMRRVIELEKELAWYKSKYPDETVELADKALQDGTTAQAHYTFSDEDYALLKALETKFSKAVYDIQMQGDYPDHLKDNLLNSLDKYALVIAPYHEEVAVQLNKLDQSIEQDEEKFQNNINHTCQLLEDVAKNIRLARKSSFNEEHNAHLIKTMKRVMAALRA